MSQYFVLIPCAGIGARLQDALPKQYLPLLGKPMLRHSLDCFEGMPSISRIYVVASAAHVDLLNNSLAGCVKTEVLLCGGGSRAETVFNGLNHLRTVADAEDWVLVHDAARPGIDVSAVERLQQITLQSTVGGLLALPLADTLKRGDESGVIQATIPRNDLWMAQTPQMFRIGQLYAALSTFLVREPTDEAQAMEWADHQPQLVLGSLRNMKVTYPADLATVAALMQANLS